MVLELVRPSKITSESQGMDIVRISRDSTIDRCINRQSQNTCINLDLIVPSEPSPHPPRPPFWTYITRIPTLTYSMGILDMHETILTV